MPKYVKPQNQINIIAIIVSQKKRRFQTTAQKTPEMCEIYIFEANRFWQLFLSNGDVMLAKVANITFLVHSQKR